MSQITETRMKEIFDRLLDEKNLENDEFGQGTPEGQLFQELSGKVYRLRESATGELETKKTQGGKSPLTPELKAEIAAKVKHDEKIFIQTLKDNALIIVHK